MCSERKSLEQRTSGAEESWSPDGDLGTQEKVALSCSRQERPSCPQGPGEVLLQCGQRGLCEGKRPAGWSPQPSWGPPGIRERGPRVGGFCARGLLEKSARGARGGKWVPGWGVLPILIPRGHLGTGLGLGARPRPKRGGLGDQSERGLSRGERVGAVELEEQKGGPLGDPSPTLRGQEGGRLGDPAPASHGPPRGRDPLGTAV